MKKYLVIGNPIEHSLSPKLHNYWIKKNNIEATYDKKLLKEEELKNIIFKVKKEEIHGINVTLPFKKSVITYVDELTPEAEKDNIWINNVDGKSKKLKRFIPSPKVYDGAVITIGQEEKTEPIDKTEFAKELASIIADFLQIALTLVIISNTSGG